MEMTRVFGTVVSLLLMFMLASFLGCEGDQGPKGPTGDEGPPGPPGDPGTLTPPSDMYFGLAITNNSDYDQNGNSLIKLTFLEDQEEPDPDPGENVLVGYRLDKPPVLDGQDKGEEDWGTSELFASEVALTNIRGVDNGIGTMSTPVTLRAGYDEEYVYFMVKWKEETAGNDDVLFSPGESKFRNRWRYDGDNNTWRQQFNEDQLFIYWDISGIADWDTEGSALLYHDSDSSIYLDRPGMADVWHWMAARTGLIGYFDGGYVVWDEETMFGIQPDQGTAAYIANVEDDLPKWMHREDPNYGELSLPFNMWDTAPFDAGANWDDNATIYGYVTVLPLGSRADIECNPQGWAQALPEHWVVEFRRLRNTGQGDDVQF
jgi:hypothetical protein